jgi:hypothetical protein
MLIAVQCPSAQCTLYAVDDRCTSVCVECGVLCEAFPIRDLVSLSLYKEQGCNIVAGDLFILSLPTDVSESALLEGLEGLHVIQGHMYIMHNEHLPSVTFMKHLERVDGITYVGNPILIDAHLHGLESYTIPIVVEGCPRLCPARYTDKTESGEDESACPNPRIRFLLHVAGHAAEDELDVLGDVLVRAMRNTTLGVVCDVHVIIVDAD